MKTSRTTALALACAFVLGRLSTSHFAEAQDGAAAGETSAVEQVPAGQPRYLEAMRRELEAMGIEAACATVDAQRAHCQMQLRGEGSHRTFEVRAVYSDETDTIYVYVDRYLMAPSGAAGTDALMRHLMELNWRMLVGKFEWDPASGQVRLAMILHTDSNFDRRAFRSVIRAIQDQADRLHAELTPSTTIAPH